MGDREHQVTNGREEVDELYSRKSAGEVGGRDGACSAPVVSCNVAGPPLTARRILTEGQSTPSRAGPSSRRLSSCATRALDKPVTSAMRS